MEVRGMRMKNILVSMKVTDAHRDQFAAAADGASLIFSTAPSQEQIDRAQIIVGNVGLDVYKRQGQRKGEMLSETVRRELLEETGYTVTPLRLSGIYERISEGRDEGLSHKIYFIFLCKLEDVPCKTPSERDRFQIGLEWIDLRRIRTCNLFPRAIRDNLSGLIGYGETIFIGSEKE